MPDDQETRRRTPVPVWLAIVFALICGAGVAVQSRINGELGQQLGDGFVAATISFGSGLLILLVALAIAPSGRRGLGRVASALRARSLPWWYVLGGSAGAFLVLSQGLTAAVLGVALFTVAIVAGQTVSGLVLDRIGLGPGGRRRLTPSRVTGAVLALIAVTWAVSAQLTHSVPLWMLLLPLIAGLGMGWQQAVNGQVRVVASSALSATFINFVVGTTVLVIAMVVHSSIAGWPSSLPTEWWLYLGGAIGCVFIAGVIPARAHHRRAHPRPRDRCRPAADRARARPGAAEFRASGRLDDRRRNPPRARRRRRREHPLASAQRGEVALRIDRRAVALA